MPSKNKYDYHMKKEEFRTAWEKEKQKKEGDKIINPLTHNEINFQGATYIEIENAYQQYIKRNPDYTSKTSPRSASPRAASPSKTSPRAASSRAAASTRKASSHFASSSGREIGKNLNKKQTKIKDDLEIQLDSFSSNSTYRELKVILEDLIGFNKSVEDNPPYNIINIWDIELLIKELRNQINYNPPYYNKEDIIKWIDKMKEPKYQERYIYYDIVTNRDYLIYNNTNLYFKTIMYAFIYGLLNTDSDIPKSLSENSINGNIPSRFIELLNLVFKKYDYRKPTDEENSFMIELDKKYHHIVDFYRIIDFYQTQSTADTRFLEEFKYLIFRHHYNDQTSEKEFEIYKKNMKMDKFNHSHIQIYLKNTLLKHNEKFQLSKDAKEFQTKFPNGTPHKQ